MDEYISKVHRLRKAVRERVQDESTNPNQDAMAGSGELEIIASEHSKVRIALDKLKGRDRVGVIGEGAAVLGGASAGVALAGSAAGAAGATTLLGSTSLASLLGGVFVTTTPIGWVLGSAAVAGAAGYGIAKLIQSGGKQDQRRGELSDRIAARLVEHSQSATDGELETLLAAALETGAVSTASGQKMRAQIDDGLLSVELALLRLRAIADVRKGAGGET
ncbi:TPA: hypothetical protein L4967_004944 [Pseudomonas aeruginosa]|nr:hypothetical protein [Pseudomonas aeruginosa]HEP9173677.1 hypothetical protein [Pseudomonas aeruginosa]